jgi:hypothetical protein
MAFKNSRERQNKRGTAAAILRNGFVSRNRVMLGAELRRDRPAGTREALPGAKSIAKRDAIIAELYRRSK